MRNLLFLVALIVSVPAWAVEPPQHSEQGNYSVIYDEGGTTIVRLDKKFLIGEDAGEFTVSYVSQGITITHKVSQVGGTNGPAVRQALNDGVGTIMELRGTWELEGRTPGTCCTYPGHTKFVVFTVLAE